MSDTVQLAELAKALRLGDHEHISIVGGGGKTLTMFSLARQLDGRRVLTTTTKMGADRTGGFRVLYGTGDAELERALSAAACDEHPSDVVLVWSRQDGHKVVGVDPEVCDRWFEQVDHVLVEADGSRQQPFKAPTLNEPVVPDTTTIQLGLIGSGALGRVIADRCHRPLRIAAVADCSAYERLTPEIATRVIVSDRGSRKGCPLGARFVAVICNVDDETREVSAELVERISAEGVEVVAVETHACL